MTSGQKIITINGVCAAAIFWCLKTNLSKSEDKVVVEIVEKTEKNFAFIVDVRLFWFKCESKMSAWIIKQVDGGIRINMPISIFVNKIHHYFLHHQSSMYRMWWQPHNKEEQYFSGDEPKYDVDHDQLDSCIKTILTL